MRQVDLPAWGGLLWEDYRHLALHGGRGGAKSRTIATALILKSTTSHRRVLCGREIQKSIKDSVKRLLDDEIARLGLSSVFDSVESEIRGPNDSLFLFSGIKGNANAIKSIEGITDFWGEEAQTFSQASLDTVIPTIRAPGSSLIWSWNPDLETDPIDVLFRGEHGPPPRSIVREVNHDENPWFPEELRLEMEFDRSRDIDKYNHIWLGKYRQNSEARVFRNWRVEAFDSPANVEYRLGADFGFSVDPSVALRCWIDGTQIFVDHEAWGLGIEINDLPQMFLSIPDAEKYWLTADSSRPETISYLRNHGFPRIAPAIKGARSVEEGVQFLKSYDIVVHPRCQKLIDELTHYSFKTDPLTGQVLGVLEDKNNHCIAEGAKVTCERGPVPIEEVTTADRVLTRGGYRPVLFAGVTDIQRDILEVETTVGTVRCTPDHEIWVENKGMVRADALRYGDNVIGDGSWLKQSSGMERNTGDTQTVAAARIGSISSDHSPVARAHSIGTFGNSITARFLRAGMSTTLTAIRSTMTYRILSALIRKVTAMSTRLQPNATQGRRSTLPLSGARQRLGTAAPRVAKSTERLAHWLTPTLTLPRSHASIATTNSPRASSVALTASAPTSAGLLTEGRQVSMMWNGDAFAACPSPSTATASHNLVHGRVLAVREAGQCERVYDLTVEEHHEFFADGVLVSNCIDALRYAVEGARRALNAKPKTVSVTIPKTVMIAGRR